MEDFDKNRPKNHIAGKMATIVASALVLGAGIGYSLGGDAPVYTQAEYNQGEAVVAHNLLSANCIDQLDRPEELGKPARELAQGYCALQRPVKLELTQEALMEDFQLPSAPQIYSTDAAGKHAQKVADAVFGGAFGTIGGVFGGGTLLVKAGNRRRR